MQYFENLRPKNKERIRTNIKCCFPYFSGFNNIELYRLTYEGKSFARNCGLITGRWRMAVLLIPQKNVIGEQEWGGLQPFFNPAFVVHFL